MLSKIVSWVFSMIFLFFCYMISFHTTPYCFSFGTYFFFWPRHAACGILVPQPGIEPFPPPAAVEAQSINHWTAREVPVTHLLKRESYPDSGLWTDRMWGLLLTILITCVCARRILVWGVFVGLMWDLLYSLLPASNTLCQKFCLKAGMCLCLSDSVSA